MRLLKVRSAAWQILFTSLVTLGGGLAVLALLRKGLVEQKGVISDKEFADVFSFVQVMPGSLLLNFAAIIGFRLAGALGAIACIAAAILPPLIVVVLIGWGLLAYGGQGRITAVLFWLRPVVLAIIFDMVLSIFRANGLGRKNIFWAAGFLMIISLLNLPAYVGIVLGLAVIFVVYFLRKRQNDVSCINGKDN